MSVLTLAARLGRTGTVIAAVIVATVINLLVYVVAWALGATYEFTSAVGAARVDALTLTGFTAVPLLAGMTMAAVLSRWWRWVIPVALVVAPVLAIGSVPFMPLAVDFDTASAVALATAHVVVGAVAVVGLLGLRALSPVPAVEVVAS